MSPCGQTTEQPSHVGSFVIRDVTVTEILGAAKVDRAVDGVLTKSQLFFTTDSHNIDPESPMRYVLAQRCSTGANRGTAPPGDVACTEPHGARLRRAPYSSIMSARLVVCKCSRRQNSEMSCALAGLRRRRQPLPAAPFYFSCIAGPPRPLKRPARTHTRTHASARVQGTRRRPLAVVKKASAPATSPLVLS